MSFPAYPEYKDSGVLWLGAVPSHWDVSPVKALTTFNDEVLTETCDPQRELEYIEISDVDEVSGIKGATAMLFADAPSRARRIVRTGDILISTVRTYLRAIAPVPSELDGAIASTGFCVVRSRSVHSHFIGYALRSEAFVAEVIARSVGVSYPAINASDLVSIRIPMPSASEQAAISAFLDRETAKIDALVAEQERLIALLKEKRQAVISHAVTKGLNPNAPMKDSGIEWLGEIPAHWEVVRVASLYREAARIGSEDLPILSVSIHRGVSDFEIPDEDMERNVARSEDRTKYKRVQPNDLVYNMMRAWQGGFGAVQTHGQVSPAYVVAEPLKKLRSEYVEALLRTPSAVEEMRRRSRGVTDFRLRLYWDEFKDMKVPWPPEDEVDKILEEGASLAHRFTALEKASQSAITLLQERRAALISAAVTGKIDVRGQAASAVLAPLVAAPVERVLPSLRAVVGGVVVLKLGQMGRMAVMKGGYLAEAHCGLNEIGGRYERYAAGPYDSSLIAAMEQGAFELCGITTDGPAEVGERVTYNVPRAACAPVEALRALAGEDRSQRLSRLLADLSGIGRDGVEAVATIYAVWNDLKAAGHSDDDDAIFTGVLTDWHDEKAKKFKRADLEHWIAWMRRNGLVPNGTAPRTDRQGALPL